MSPSEIIRQEDSGPGVSPARGSGTEQGPNEDQNDMGPSPGTETQPPNEDDVELSAAPQAESQGPNEDDAFGDEPAAETAEGTGEEPTPAETTGEAMTSTEGETVEEFPTPLTHDEADEQAARLGTAFPEDVTKVIDKAEFIANHRRENAAPAGESA